MLSFLNAKEAKEFGVSMARDFAKRMPPDAVLKDRQFAKNAHQIIEKMSKQIATYRERNTLNIYKIAKMANAFKWELKDAGYQDEYVDSLTHWFIVKVKN